MNFRRTDWQTAGGTCLQGHVAANYADLVAVFGEPGPGDGYKVDAEWVLLFEDGTVATVYNYKDGRNYEGADGLDVQDITDWHVGGRSARAVELVLEALGR